MKKLKKYYQDKFNMYGPKPKGVSWSNNKKTKLRYKNLLKVLNFDRKSNFSILDVGCGYGELINHLPINKKYQYTGIDIVNEMINYAKKKQKKKNLEFKLKNIYNLSKKYDFIVCNGLFTLKNNLSNKEMKIFLSKCINIFYKFSKIGFSFNIMSENVDYKSKILFYTKLTSILKILSCKKISKINVDCQSVDYETFFFIKK